MAEKRGAEGKDGRLKEKSWVRKGGRGGSRRGHPASPARLNPRPRPGGKEAPGSPLGHLKAARSKVGNKKFLFRTFGLRFGNFATPRGRGSEEPAETGGGRAAPPGPRAPVHTHALLPKAASGPPPSRCRARTAVKVTGRTARHGTGDSGPRGQPPHAPHTSRPPECNVT